MHRRLELAVVLLWSAAGACAAPPGGPRVERHVVLISVDGLRPEAIERAPAPNIAALTASGAVTLTARAVEIPETLASHVTMATGLPPSRHHVDWNDDRGGTLELPTLFTQVHDAGGRTGLYIGKSKLLLLAPRQSADIVRGPQPKNKDWDAGSGGKLAAQFAADLPRERFRFALVHLREPDQAGHDRGWMSADYLAAVRKTDAAVGVIRRAVADAGLAASTTLILTSDHGGEGRNHGGDIESTFVVPFICAGPAQRRVAIGDAVTLVDLAPTVLAWLQLPALPAAQGKPIPECL